MTHREPTHDGSGVDNKPGFASPSTGKSAAYLLSEAGNFPIPQQDQTATVSAMTQPTQEMREKAREWLRMRYATEANELAYGYSCKGDADSLALLLAEATAAENEACAEYAKYMADLQRQASRTFNNDETRMKYEHGANAAEDIYDAIRSRRQAKDAEKGHG